MKETFLSKSKARYVRQTLTSHAGASRATHAPEISIATVAQVRVRSGYARPQHPKTSASRIWKTGAGMREVGDRPLSRLYFWSIRTTLCTAAYIKMHIEPKREFKWHITFYTLNGASPQ